MGIVVGAVKHSQISNRHAKKSFPWCLLWLDVLGCVGVVIAKMAVILKMKSIHDDQFWKV